MTDPAGAAGCRSSSRAGQSPSRDTGGDSRAAGVYRQAPLTLGDAGHARGHSIVALGGDLGTVIATGPVS